MLQTNANAPSTPDRWTSTSRSGLTMPSSRSTARSGASFAAAQPSLHSLSTSSPDRCGYRPCSTTSSPTQRRTWSSSPGGSTAPTRRTANTLRWSNSPRSAPSAFFASSPLRLAGGRSIITFHLMTRISSPGISARCAAHRQKPYSVVVVTSAGQERSACRAPDARRRAYAPGSR
jgi:hypothetical protein